MKRIVALFICALLALTNALAEPPIDGLIGSDTPPRGNGEGNEGITLDVGDETVRLVFDASPQYSSIQGGTVQASYYAYGADGKTLYELYISFPQTARAGMVLTPEYAALTNEECSVVLIVSDDAAEQYYFSSLLDGSTYPADSTFSIALEGVTGGESAITYSGTLSARLIALDMASGSVADTLEIPKVPFRFTVAGKLDAPPASPNVPSPTHQPDDLRKA